MVGKNSPPLDGWCCLPHREPPLMTAPVAEASEDHIVRGTE